MPDSDIIEKIEALPTAVFGADRILFKRAGAVYQPDSFITIADLKSLASAYQAAIDERERLRAALENCLLMSLKMTARRNKVADDEWRHIHRFCAEAGISPTITTRSTQGRKEMSEVVTHQFQADRLSKVAKRFMELRDAHKRASDCLWTGMLAAEFTDADLRLLPDYLSPHDVRLIQKVRQPLPADAPTRAQAISQVIAEK